MPTLAQRQRAAHHGMVAPGRPQSSSSSSKVATTGKTQAQFTTTAPGDDDASSSDDSDEDLAFEMDGQELWAQNFCATCDCLIEPGAGVGAKPSVPDGDASKSTAAMTRSNSSASTSSTIDREDHVNHTAGLKSKNGTIKGRPLSSEVAKAAKDSKSTANGLSNVKRTSSAGRLHAVGGGAGMGTHKRTGSAASRLNALSDLKPTTKLNAHEKSKGVESEGKRSPALSRRSSNVSTTSGDSGRDKSARSGESSPASSSTGLPRTKKGGLLGPLSPAILKQEAEASKAPKAPPALFCSERCRLIDADRASGLGELVQYLSQPYEPSAPHAWATSGWGAAEVTAEGTTVFPTRPSSLASAPMMAYSAGYVCTPESECCTCAECLDKLSSGGGTVPSGASDTTESSASASTGYMYGQPGRQKQRTKSGRIMTPHGLQGHADSYFSMVPTSAARPLDARRYSPSQTSIIDAIGSRSTADDPEAMSATIDKQTNRVTTAPSYPRSRPSTTSDDAPGTATTGTVTPATTIVARRSPTHSLDSLRWSTALDGSDTKRHGNGIGSYAESSPMRLLRHGQHHSQPSVEHSSELAHSPFASVALGTSQASNGAATELGSSVTTLNHRLQGTTISRRRAAGGRDVPSTLALADGDTEHSNSAFTITDSTDSAVEGKQAPTQRNKNASEDRLSSSLGTPSALSALKQAAARTAAIAPTLADLREGHAEHHSGVNGFTSADRAHSQALAARRASSSSNSSSSTSGWLKSLSSAWATIRGAPSSSSLETDIDQGTVPSSEAQRAKSALSSRRGSSSSYKRGELLSPAVGSLTALSSLDAQSRGEEPTPTQSLISRPAPHRGTVPAFAKDLAHSANDGVLDDLATSASSGRSGERLRGTHESSASMRTPSTDATRLSADEEARRRRRAEHRHQRSKEITMLPPLLGHGRSASNSTPANGRPRSVRAMSGAGSVGVVDQAGRSRAGSQSQLHIGSAGSQIAPHFPGLSRPTTPAFRRSPYGSNGADFPPPVSFSNPSSLGTSPRRAGLGWGPMTAILPAPDSQHPVTHGHSSSISLGHALRPGAVHPTSARQHPHHQPMHRHQTHQQHSHAHGHGGKYAHHRGTGPVPLGHVGLLGAHPHGQGPVYGRHATTPVRSSTPRVPEDGGEMSSAAFAGADEGPATTRPTSTVGYRGSQSSLAPPRPRSVLAMRAINGGSMTPLVASPTGAPPMALGGPRAGSATQNTRTGSGQQGRTWSYEALPGMKTYPVLNLPGRVTHDRYDEGWNLGEGDLEELMTGRRTPAPASSAEPNAAEPATHTTPQSSRRKTLFYFDA
ncbi:hypothetical protein CBOM_03325 [Ceraceosorus bombacis]|uniref:Uncharacterized protein n=1 Tax=Ceraceosorus bombacis TaxID=401625 RepID=A0A0P1BNH4_9BASI|nr:hypothetical protein CBOM_03325 [Ceraceosorus bombacis]